MADIFDEVSEELKQDQLIKTWKKYSKFIVSPQIRLNFITEFFLLLQFLIHYLR